MIRFVAPTPTPTPWIRAYSRNPGLTLLSINQFRHEQYTTVWSTINSASNTSSFVSPSVFNTTRGMAACWDPATRVNVGVTPAPAGTVSSQYASGSLLCRRVYWGNWNTGLRQATFIFVTPTPGPSLTPTQSPTPLSSPTPTLTLTPTITLSPTPGPVYSVSGSIYLRNNATETSCSEVSGVDTKVNQLDSQLSVAAGGQTVNVGHTGMTGDFFISGIPESSSSLPVELFGVDTTKYEWVRPAGNSQGVPNICTTPSSPSIFNQDVSNVNWFIRELRYPWWQVIGGDVGAMRVGGVVVESKIPGGYPGSKYIIAQGGGMDQGVVVQGSSTEPVSGGGGITQFSNWWANSTYAEPREMYDVLHGYVYNGPGFTGSVNCSLSDCTALSQVAISGGSQYIYVNDDVVLSGGWSVGSGESQTYVVDGDLTIPVNVQVGSGGFLAFIVSGKITINPGVTTVQGVYVADGMLTSESLGADLDSQLDAQGMFVGWGGVSLKRDLMDDTLIGPAERFVYRPDLIIHAPSAFRRDTYLWEELQP